MEHNFSMKQKILNLCLRWHILRSYCFVAEVTFNQLMIEIFKCLKGISPPIMNEIFRLRNIPYTRRNPRDINSQLPKTVRVLWTWNYSIQRTTIMATTTWENYLVSFEQNIKLRKDCICSCWVCKTYMWGLGFR